MSAILILILRILAAISLYIFLGVIIYILWKDLVEAKTNSHSRPGSYIKVIDLGSEEFNIFSIQEIFIGRSDLCQIQLQDDETVSNLHARIFLKENNWWVEDLQSTNGTLINQDPIVTPTIITTGDQISCGKTIFEISLEDGSVASEI